MFRAAYNWSTTDVHIYSPTNGGSLLEDLTDIVLDEDYELVWDVLLQGRAFKAVDEDGWTPLHAAAVKDASFLIEPLLNAGCSLTSFNKMGWTPIHIAAGRNNTRFLSVILEPTLICVRANNDYGSTPLHIAATYGNIDFVQMLIDGGVNPNEQDYSRLTAMNYAVSYEDHPGTIELLASSGTSIDDSDNELGPPLHGAVENHLYGAAVSLIELGADTSRTTSEGLSFGGLLNSVGWSGVL